ncbi:MAG: nucleoside diphosphate kinase regulator [Chromatiales bacterium]|nr:nucleoside diphosphate kinase regulator [Chromatiales bacterium]
MNPANNVTTSSRQPAARPGIAIAAGDYARLVGLTEGPDRSEVAEYLSGELTRARIVGDDNLAANIVRMGSRVTYRDLATGRTRVITLVYPREADMVRNRISVLTPIGAALIGLCPGQSIDWPTPEGGAGTLIVVDVCDDEVEPT